VKQVFLIALVSVGLSVARTVAGGQDLNFDLQVYHYYLGYSAFVDRFGLDFLPAGFQGYQSPAPYMLLYWLDSVGTPPVVNASIHAALQALNLVLLFLLARALVGANATRRERAMVLALWLLGAIAPAYWHLVGTSYADLLTSVLVLAGLWLIATRSSLRAIAAGAALAGVAVGLRVHNAIYVAGLLCALGLARFSSSQDRLRALGTLGAGAFAGWLLCFAPWGQRVYREFGNPLFPFYNGVFRSPDFPAANLPLFSFVPGSLNELVTFPFRMAAYAHWVYIEGRVPDVRPALLAVALAGCGLLWLLRRARPEEGPATRERRLILVFFAASALLWLATSSNGRYGVALFLLGGPVCGVLLCRLLPFRYALAAIAAVVAWQALLQGLLYRESRTVSTPWAARYFDWILSDRYQREPATFLSLALQSGSTLAPRVHPASSHVNLVGQYTPNIDSPGADRIRRIIGLPHSVYGVFDSDDQSVKTDFKGHLNLWGLDFSDSACDAVPLRTGSGAMWINRIAGMTIHAAPPSFTVCELRQAAPADQARVVADYRSMAGKVERFGAACPQYFGKPFSYVRVDRRGLVTPLASLEWRLEIEDGGAVYLKQTQPPYAIQQVGRVTGEGIQVVGPDCTKWLRR